MSVFTNTASRGTVIERLREKDLPFSLEVGRSATRVWNEQQTDGAKTLEVKKEMRGNLYGGERFEG